MRGKGGGGGDPVEQAHGGWKGGGGGGGDGGGRGGGGDGGGCFTVSVSLLLRVGILMRSVNECWQRRGSAAAVEEEKRKTAALPLQDSGSSGSSFAIPFHSPLRMNVNVRLILFLSQIFFFSFLPALPHHHHHHPSLFVSHFHVLVMFFPPSL